MVDGKGFTGTFVVFLTGIFTIAIISVLVSQRAQTSAILQALGSAVGNSIGAATAPVTQGN